LWLQARRPARELLMGSPTAEPRNPAALLWWRRFVPAGWLGASLAVVAALSAAAMMWAGRHATGEDRAGLFFGAGSLWLIAALAGAGVVLRRLARSSDASGLTLLRLGLRSAARRPGRTLAVASMLACGCFLVTAISAFHQNTTAAAGRVPGDWGFDLYGELTLPPAPSRNPIAQDAALKDVRMAGLLVHEGDDASCLNLARAQHPRLLGVHLSDFSHDNQAPAAMAELDPQLWDDQAPANPDGRRTYRLEDGSIPAVGDENTVAWALHKSVGDTIDYTNERGRTVKLRIVAVLPNSLLQGNLLISDGNFLDLYPSISGPRILLIDCPASLPGGIDAVRRNLTRALENLGVEWTLTADRQALFNRVENTYLSIFQALGGLGLILGSAGLGIVVWRNIMERRAELAALRATGFTRRRLRRMLLLEHAWPLLAGLVCGTLAALVAIWPTLHHAAAPRPYALLLSLLLAIVISGLFWIALSVAAALRGRLLDALRAE
jgi:hypothetical protein